MIEALRILTVLVGGFSLGLTLVVGYLYVVFRRQGGAERSVAPLGHIITIGAAHALLTTALIAEILSRVQHGHTFHYWLTPVALAAFCLTSVALVALLRSRRVQEVHEDIVSHKEDLE